MNKLEPRHKKALVQALKQASESGNSLEARYLREALRILKVELPSAKTPSRRARPVPAFMRPMKMSAALQVIAGTKPLTRVDVVTKVWAYIKKNKLQDSVNKRMVNLDPKLKAIFGNQPQISMFEMAGRLGRHLS